MVITNSKNRIDMSKKALIVINIQNDYFKNGANRACRPSRGKFEHG